MPSCHGRHVTPYPIPHRPHQPTTEGLCPAEHGQRSPGRPTSRTLQGIPRLRRDARSGLAAYAIPPRTTSAAAITSRGSSDSPGGAVASGEFLRRLASQPRSGMPPRPGRDRGGIRMDGRWRRQRWISMTSVSVSLPQVTLLQPKTSAFATAVPLLKAFAPNTWTTTVTRSPAPVQPT